jgi:hypothetical protein
MNAFRPTSPSSGHEHAKRLMTPVGRRARPSRRAYRRVTPRADETGRAGQASELARGLRRRKELTTLEIGRKLWMFWRGTKGCLFVAVGSFLQLEPPRQCQRATQGPYLN